VPSLYVVEAADLNTVTRTIYFANMPTIHYYSHQ